MSCLAEPLSLFLLSRAASDDSVPESDTQVMCIALLLLDTSDTLRRLCPNGSDYSASLSLSCTSDLAE